MTKTLNFVCAMILFISLFLVSKNVACKTFCPLLKLSSLLFSLYVFYLILVTSFYPLFSLQYILLNVKLMLIVQKVS